MLIGKVAVTPRGAYSALTAYVRLDAVTYNGASYLVLQPVTGVTPTDDGVNYQLLAAKGAQGEEGQEGAQGPTGPAGPTGEQGDDGTTLTTLTSSAGVLTIDCALGDNFIVTLTENITSIVLSNEPTSGKAKNVSLEIVQHASSAKTVAFPAGWAWPDGEEGVVSTDLSAVDELNLIIRNPSGTKLYRAVLVKGWA